MSRFDHGDLYDGEEALWPVDADLRRARPPVTDGGVAHWFYEDEIEPCAIGGRARWKIRCQGCGRVVYGPDRRSVLFKMHGHGRGVAA